MAWDKDNLIKVKRKRKKKEKKKKEEKWKKNEQGKAGLCRSTEREKKKIKILYFPSTSDVQLLPGKQGLDTHSCFLGGQIYS